MGPQEWVRRDDLVECLGSGEELVESLPPLFVGKCVDGALDGLVANRTLAERQIWRGLFGHERGEAFLEDIEVLDNTGDGVRIEGQRFFELLENSDEIQDK